VKTEDREIPRLLPNVAGIESEVHIFALGGAPVKLRREASRIVRQAVLRRRGLWRCRGCKDSDVCGRSEFLANGSRCYIDHGYLEYSTPCSSSTREVVAAVRAGDAVIREAVKDANLRLAPTTRLMAVRNTCDHRGHTYAAHVNVSMTRQAFDRLMEDKRELLHETVGPMLASVPLVCGAGRAGSDDGEDIFQVSQRADYIRAERGPQTTSDRPLLNTRDEPLADGRRHARLHVICLDANRLDTPQYLKIGIVRLLCASLDLGIPTVAIPLAEPVRAMRAISRSPFGPVRLTSGRTITALGIQESFLSALSKRSSDLAERVPDVFDILRRWQCVLAALGRDYLALVGTLDWVTKFAYLEVARGDARTQWSDPRLAWRDIGYHVISSPEDRNRVTFRQADQASIVSQAEIEALIDCPPRGGRDAVRVGLMSRFPADITTCDWHWIASSDGSCCIMPDPAAGPKEMRDSLAASTSLTGAARALGLPLARMDRSVPLLTDFPHGLPGSGGDDGGWRCGLPGKSRQRDAEEPTKRASSADGPRRPH